MVIVRIIEMTHTIARYYTQKTSTTKVNLKTVVLAYFELKNSYLKLCTSKTTKKTKVSCGENECTVQYTLTCDFLEGYIAHELLKPLCVETRSVYRYSILKKRNDYIYIF